MYLLKKEMYQLHWTVEEFVKRKKEKINSFGTDLS